MKIKGNNFHPKIEEPGSKASFFWDSHEPFPLSFLKELLII
jgi:hypothetical protein